MKIIPRRFSKQEIQERVNWINDPKINRTMYFDLPATIENTTEWYEKNIGNTNRIDFSFFDSNENVIAMGGFTKIDKVHNHAEFYIMVNPTLHGKGYGKEVSKWIFNYGFSILKLHKIYLYTDDDNKAAYKIYEDAGFLLEGVLREHKWKIINFTTEEFMVYYDMNGYL